MDMSMDLFILPAVIFTIFAIIVGAFVLWKIQVSAPSTTIYRNSAVKKDGKPSECMISSQAEAFTHCKEQENKTTNCLEELYSGPGKPNIEWEATTQTTKDILQSKAHQTIAESQCEKGNGESADCPTVKRVGGEDKPLKCMPGMLRTSQLEKMMSKEELEEEQRVQREQLAAIFKLLKENQDTFGEMTEKDMEQQLKLYSI
ncbi:matrix-remodeling-associated protein 7-like [Electrophorus electricus]|nr:matrix-remodeling-associated protein 7-like [Electrophorus electricus]